MLREPRDLTAKDLLCHRFQSDGRFEPVFGNRPFTLGIPARLAAAAAEPRRRGIAWINVRPKRRLERRIPRRGNKRFALFLSDSKRHSSQQCNDAGPPLALLRYVLIVHFQSFSSYKTGPVTYIICNTRGKVLFSRYPALISR